MAKSKGVPLVDLETQRLRMGVDLGDAILRVLEHGQYVMGPEILELEAKLAELAGVARVVTCSSGTDALLMVLMARGIGVGDAVICPAFTFTATPEVIALVGATPVFADVNERTYNLEPQALRASFLAAERLGLIPRCIIAADLFGHPAEYSAIEEFARSEGMFVLADAAQSLGGSYRGKPVGSLGLATATSFFPTKPLGCYGDGGAVFTNDAALADTLASIRQHGRGAEKYHIDRIGINGRLDTIQAAVLLVKLKVFAEELRARSAVAGWYDSLLSDFVHTPMVEQNCVSTWAQYTIRVSGAKRNNLMQKLAEENVGSAVYYPRAIHEQPAYRRFPISEAGLQISERLTREVLSLPMHPYLARSDVEQVATIIRRTVVS